MSVARSPTDLEERTEWFGAKGEKLSHPGRNAVKHADRSAAPKPRDGTRFLLGLAGLALVALALIMFWRCSKHDRQTPA